jgi:hypothetical protein
MDRQRVFFNAVMPRHHAPHHATTINLIVSQPTLKSIVPVKIVSTVVFDRISGRAMFAKDPELNGSALQLAKELGIGGKDKRNTLKKFLETLQNLLDNGKISQKDIIAAVKHPPKIYVVKGEYHVELNEKGGKDTKEREDISEPEIIEKVCGKEGKGCKGDKGGREEQAA